MALEKLGLTEYGEFLEQLIQESADRGQTGLELIEEFDTDLLCHAKTLVGYGVSHRGLQVGACALAFDLDGVPQLLEGFNFSPFKGARKRCAEIGTLTMGRERRVHSIPGFWIATLSDENLPGNDNLNFHVNGVTAPTLHPCPSPCREELSRSPLVDHKSTLFTTMTATTGAVERHTLAGFVAKYAHVATPQSSYETARLAS